MLVNIRHDTAAEHRRLLLLGVVFVAVISLLIGLSIAIYDKVFDRSDIITIQADRAGLQLPKFGDVRLHGVLVGQVRSIDDNGTEAVITVAIDPATLHEIPTNVGVQILPTTLFGQKFISLVPSPHPSSTMLSAGDVIPSIQVQTNVELGQVLAHLFPLLRAVRPADLNATLSALADALDGRGAQLGQNLDHLDTYLHGIAGSLPTLRSDLVRLADVADTYDVAAPDLLRTLGNLTVTSKTVLQKQQQLHAFFDDLAGLGDTATRVLDHNGANLIRVGRVGAPVLHLLATYSPELPCLLKGAARYAPILSKTFAGNQVKQYIEFGANQYRAYDQRDLPKYGELGHGPWCSGLPRPPVPIGPAHFKDGTSIDTEPANPVTPQNRVAPGWATAAGYGPGMSSGYAGTAGDQAVTNALLAGHSGRPADSYGALGSLLYGPVVRGGGR